MPQMFSVIIVVSYSTMLVAMNNYEYWYIRRFLFKVQTSLYGEKYYHVMARLN